MHYGNIKGSGNLKLLYFIISEIMNFDENILWAVLLIYIILVVI